MNKILPSTQINIARKATLLIFLVCGIGISSWAPMVPIVKLKLNLNDAELGLVLLSLGLGAIVTMPFVSVFINNYGTRKIMLVSATIIAIILPFLLLANTSILLAIFLFIFGAALGTIDVSMNAHAVLIQQHYGRHIMSSFHGLFSAGGLVGAIGIGLLIKFGLSPVYAAICISGLILLIAYTQYAQLLPHSFEGKSDDFKLSFPKGPVLILGILCFILFLSEGALLDWSAVFLQFNRGFSVAMSGLGYASFSVAMAIMRLTGDKIVNKIGAQKVVVYGCLIASIGFILAVVVPNPIVSILGFTLVGFGAANVVPVFFTAAGNIPGIKSSVSLPAVTTLGYIGQLAGPALIGFMAELFSLPAALASIGILLLFVSFSYKHR